MYASKITPRNGHTYQIGIVARISGCQNQKEMSLEDQVDHSKDEASRYCDPETPVKYHIISTKGKGERLDRPELLDIENLLRSRLLDLLVVEDLGRLVRGTAASELCGIAVDHGVRVLAPNDCIDTADASWEEDVISACRDHVGHNAHTSKRLKHKMMNRFIKMGASMARPIYGYTVPKEARTYTDWLKDDSATPVLVELFNRYKRFPNFSHLADWLNSEAVPTGPYDRIKRWNSTKVRRLMSNPLLKGIARRGCRHTVKHHETGRRISVRKTTGPVYFSCPHLLHVPEDLWNEVNELREFRNSGLGRKPLNGEDPRSGIARKRTVFPGQHARCSICRRVFYWGGHGKKSGMMCSGVREYACWNAISINGLEASKRIVHTVLEKLEALPEFDALLMQKLKDEATVHQTQANVIAQQVEHEVQQVTNRIQNLVNAISQTGMDEEMKITLMAHKSQRQHLNNQLEFLRQQPTRIVELPPMDTLRDRARSAIVQLASASPEFSQLMNQIVTDLVFVPYRICDGNRVVLRAKFTMDLTPFVSETLVNADLSKALRHEVIIDLFDPPQRVQHRQQLVALIQEGTSLREAARQVGITLPAAQNAMKLHHKMSELGVSDPFLEMQHPPADDTKLKRHLHSRYEFRPVFANYCT